MRWAGWQNSNMSAATCLEPTFMNHCFAGHCRWGMVTAVQPCWHCEAPQLTQARPFPAHCIRVQLATMHVTKAAFCRSLTTSWCCAAA